MTYPCGTIYRDIEQGTDAWQNVRRGKITASKIADILGKGKNGAELAGRKNYRSQLVVERLTGRTEESYCNDAMRRGTELEPVARLCYEFLKGVDVEQVAFVDHPTIPLSGASPDGMIGTEGLIEIKVPNTATHIDYMLGRVVPAQYVPQMTWQLACTGRDWCDFVSYNDILPEEYQLFICRLYRDDAKIAEIEGAVIEFSQSVNNMINELKGVK